jgi:hypothetical protein
MDSAVRRMRASMALALPAASSAPAVNCHTALCLAPALNRHADTSRCRGVQVAKSVEYVQAGTTHLVAAKRLQKNTRKWMCVALILLLIIAAAIAIPVAINLTK